MKKIFILAAICSIALPVLSQWNKLPVVISPKFKKDTTSIVKFGAIPDGFNLNTKSINDAITAVSKKGGGVVFVPAGLWLTGPVVIKSNVNLHLAQGATLLFTADKSQYPLVAANWVVIAPNAQPVSGICNRCLVNIAITGKGIIDGNGDPWRAVKNDKLTASQWKKLVASGGVLSEDKKTWYPSESFMKGSKMPANPGMITSL